MAPRRKFAFLSIAIALLMLVAACASDAKTDAGGGSGTTSAPAATGPAPGVTDTSIKIGITYVDTDALVKSGLSFKLGDHKATYTALIDDINAKGGINGRKLEPVFAPIDPTSTAPAEAACLKLTEDDKVFMVTGFFLADAVLCPVATHATAVTGGEMTPSRLAQAKAPWITWTPDTDQPEAVIKAYNDAGKLNGKVAIFSDARDSDVLNDHVLPVLKDLGIEPVEQGTVDAPADDTAAVNNQVGLIAQRFDAAGADTILLVGPSASEYTTYMQNDASYRPKLLFLDLLGGQSFATNSSTTDLTILEGSMAGGSYGPSSARYAEPEMQKCIAILQAAGLDVPAPGPSDDPGNQPYQAAFQACPDMALLSAWIQAAGKDLNYGTLGSAIDGLKVTIPGDPNVRTYGAPPAADGNPTAYLFAWDPAKKDFVIAQN